MQVPEHSWSNDEDLPIHKRDGYMERVMEAADMRRKELREEGASCNNCAQCKDNPGHHCHMFQKRPEHNVCYHWARTNGN